MPDSPRSDPRAWREPTWTRLRRRRLPGIGPASHAWLRDPGSLTRALVATCCGRFTVRVLRQGRGSALPSEARLLASGPAQTTLVREVGLNCDAETWVFARTVIPAQDLRGPALGLTMLGQRPLGEVLFSDPTTRRLRVDVAVILPRHRLFARAAAQFRSPPAKLFGRRTLFAYGGQRILVNELFHPDIPEIHL